MKKDFLTLDDIKREEMLEIFDLAKQLQKRPPVDYLKGKVFCLLFEKLSTRTRVSFEAGIKQLGGHTIFLDRTTSQMSRETIEDTAKVLDGYVDGIIARVYNHKTLEIMAKCTSIPIVNALSGLSHPCQILSDLFTIREKFKITDGIANFRGLKLAYVGDGNNVCNSLLLGCSKMGIDISIACPEGHEPRNNFLQMAKNYSSVTKSKIVITQEPVEAVKDANIVYTDVWISLGMEKEEKERLKIFRSYQVNEFLTAHANPDYVFMHCLPAHRDLEVASEVIDGPHSIVWKQAENRLHVQKPLLLKLLKLV